MKFLVVIFCVIHFSYGQNFKENLSFHQNGQPKKVLVKNENLSLIKSMEYDELGNKISEYNYDPLKGIREGEYFNSIGRGNYNQGELNCDDCSVIVSSFLNDLKFTGKFRNGRPIGKISVWREFEKYEEFIMDLSYSESGKLHGVIEPNRTTEILYSNGFIKGFITFDDFDKKYIRDSIFIQNEIWKIDGIYQERFGLPKIIYNEFKDPESIRYEVIEYESLSLEDLFEIIDGSVKNELDINGVFSITNQNIAKEGKRYIDSSYKHYYDYIKDNYPFNEFKKGNLKIYNSLTFDQLIQNKILPKYRLNLKQRNTLSKYVSSNYRTPEIFPRFTKDVEKSEDLELLFKQNIDNHIRKNKITPPGISNIESVRFSIEIGKDGLIKSIDVPKEKRHPFNREIVRIISLLEPFLPYIKNGKPSTIIYNHPQGFEKINIP